MLAMSNIVFAEWVREQRARRRWSQTELANALGVKPTHVSRIESGERGTSVDLLIKLSEIFRIPLEEVVYMAAGYKSPGKVQDTITKTTEKIIRGFRKRETKEKALTYLEYLAQQEEQANHNENPSIYSTHVEMNRGWIAYSGTTTDLLHARGDEPFCGRSSSGRGRIYSTHVEMNRPQPGRSGVQTHLLHARGDEPPSGALST